MGYSSGVTEPIHTVAGFQWIIVDPDLLGGQPTVKGTRLSVSHILACLSEGMTGGIEVAASGANDGSGSDPVAAAQLEAV